MANTRRAGLECPDCKWRLEPACTGPTLDDLCTFAVTECGPQRTLFDVMLLRPPATDYSRVDDVCLGPNDPRSPADLIPDVRDQFVEYLPVASPSFQPANGAVVNVPTIFAANQPTSLERTSFTLAGYLVDVEASPTWRWDFGDGETLDTTSPGGSFPDTSVTHTYTDADDRSVTVQTGWAGRFWIDGFGPFELAGPPITQTSAPMPVEVREARAVLVAD